MIYDLQKADFWKRASAWLFDAIILFVATVGFACIVNLFIDFQPYYKQYSARREFHEEQLGITFEVNTDEDLEALTDEERALYTKLSDALKKDAEVQYALTMLFQLTLIMATFSLLLAFLLLEFIVPLIFKNGQTFGKKMFGIGVMRIDGVKISPVILFIRSILGKYTIETMVPIYILISMLFGVNGIVGLIVILVIIVTGIFLLIKTKTRSSIHDMFAHTVCVDMASQLIFNSPEELLQYKQEMHKKRAEEAEYFD